MNPVQETVIIMSMSFGERPARSITVLLTRTPSSMERSL